MTSDPTSESPPAAALAPAPDDQQLFCPACAYNLTGLSSTRCPECGSLYDLDALRALRDDEITYTMPWELTDQLTFRQRLLYTAYVSVGRPEPFCKSFGFIPRRTRAASFLICCLGLLALTIAVIGALAAFVDAYLPDTHLSPSFARYVLLPVAQVLFAILLQTLAAAVALTLLVPHNDARRHFWPWWTMLRYAAAHFLLLPPFLLVGILLGAVYGLNSIAGVYLFLIVGYIGCTFLWVFTIRHFVRHRARRGRLFSWTLTLFLLVFAITAAVFLALGIEQLYDWLYFALIRLRRGW